MKLLLFYSVSLSLSRYFPIWSYFANAALVNQTIDDSEVEFKYLPSVNWQQSNNASCVTCLQPNFTLAFQGTLHYAIHASERDADDFGKPSSLSPSASEAPVPPFSASLPPSSALPQPSQSPSPSPASPPPSTSVQSSSSSAPSSLSSSAPTPVAVAVVPTTNKAIVTPSSILSTPAGSTEDSGGKGGGHHSKRDETMLRRTDADDPNFVDVNITATINFTGSAFYVFCALPVQINNASILGLTNLTFFLDGRFVGNFTHNPRLDSDSSTGFQYQVLVFSKDDLPYAPHVLVIKPALGSMLLLDYVQYSTLETASGTSSGSAPQASASGNVESASNSSSKKNTTTFAVAIGSTMGVLAVLSFAVFLSICMRRRKSAKREKEREAMESALRPPSPEMRGPRPFIPRYFPGNFPGNIPPPASLPPPFPYLSATSSRGEESGPSHGLDFPPAPEHLDAPAYSPPPLVLSEVTRIPVSMLTPATRMPSPREEVELPQYHDVGRTPLVSITAYTHTSAVPPRLMETSPSWRDEGGDNPSPSSTTSLLPGRPDINQEENARRTNLSVSTINDNPDEQPG